MTDDLSTILRDRVADAQPDLDRLVRVATAQGTRIRRRRRAGVAVGAAAALAVVGAGAAATLGGTPQASAPQIADGPSATRSTPAARVEPTPVTNADGLRVGQKVRFPSGGSGVVVQTPGGPMTLVVKSAETRGDGSTPPDDPKTDDTEYIVQTFPHTPFRFVALHQHGSVPFREKATGWTCQYAAADEKATCTKPGAIASLNWRPASEYSGFTDPRHADLGKGYADTGVTPVHGAWFATVQPMTTSATTTQKDIDRLVAGLVWK